jgi:hypothetical protein
MADDPKTRNSADTRSVPGQPGVGVDSSGGQVIDPTKNVEDLVEAKSQSDESLRKENQRFFDSQINWVDKYQTFARESEARLQNFARKAESKFQSSRTDAETRRIDQLAETRQEFQNTIRDMLAESVRTTSTLVSTQLVQIQATFDTRVSKLEAQAFTAAGRSSVADPAIEGAMARMSQGIASLSTQTAESMNKMAAINSEALAKLSATMAIMQSSVATSAGEQAGSGEAASAQTRAAAFELLKTQSSHGSTQLTISIAVGVVAAIGLVVAIFSAMRTPTPAPMPAYQVPGQAAPPAPQNFHQRGTGYRAILL